MPRIKGQKNKATLKMEELILVGMDPEKAKVRAKKIVALEKARSVRLNSKNKTQKKIDKKKIKFPPTVDGYNPTTKNAWLKAQNSNSRKHAIRAMCLLCLGGSTKDVKDCTSPDCPLYKFRITG